MPCYKDTPEGAAFPQQLLDLVSEQGESLEQPLRKTMVQSLILLSNRELMSRLRLLPVLFRLFRVPDKEVRQLMFSHIISDIRRLNRKTHNQKLNTALQNFMLTMLKDENATVAKKALDVLIELWRRSVWRDEKTCNAIANCCFSKQTNILVAALRFFIGVEDVEDEDDPDFQASVAMKDVSAMLCALCAARSISPFFASISAVISALARRVSAASLTQRGAGLPKLAGHQGREAEEAARARHQAQPCEDQEAPARAAARLGQRGGGGQVGGAQGAGHPAGVRRAELRGAPLFPAQVVQRGL